LAADPNETVARLSKQIDRMLENPATNSSASNIHVNAGGAAIWFAATCAIVSSLMCIVVTAMFVYVLIRTDRISDYQAVIYQNLPEIRELLEKKK